MYPHTNRIGGFDRYDSGDHGFCPYFPGPCFVLSQTIYTLNPINIEVKAICTYYWHDQTPISSKNFTKMICKDTNCGQSEINSYSFLLIYPNPSTTERPFWLPPSPN